jgi:vancomycin permeability regulator SanA
MSTASKRYDAMDPASLAKAPKREVAIVFGAGVYPDGTPTPYLQWRIATAVDLYKAGKVKRLLLTGDNSEEHYNEPVAMQRAAIKLGVDPDHITLDYAGYSTYDSCYRAKKIFGVKEATLVTQGYHLPRAVATCSGLGVQSIGVAAKHTERDFAVTYLLRELLATDKALFELAVKPQPTVLGKAEAL